MSGDRLALTLATLAVAVGLCLLMLRGWRSRARRQAHLPAPPPVPASPGDVQVGAVSGLFVGTTTSGDWLDRVVVHDLCTRAPGWVSVLSDGVRIEREGAPDLWFPLGDLTGAGLGEALAGTVVGRDGLLLLRWRLGGLALTSGFRADDHAEHPRLAAAVSALLPVKETTT